MDSGAGASPVPEMPREGSFMDGTRKLQDKVPFTHEWTTYGYRPTQQSGAGRVVNDPVVMASPLWYNGGDPSTFRVMNVDPEAQTL
jgi:hypothetical protein